MKPLSNEDIQAFLLVVEQQSITGAARRMNLSKSVVSKRVSDLERGLGAQLLMRSTRVVLPTDAGLMFYEAAREAMHRLNTAAETLSEHTNGLCGELRITAPLSLTQLWLGDVVADFAAAHPNLHLALELDDRILNIEAERFDLAIRVARLPDSALIARRIGVSSRVLVGSPDYVSKNGAPASLDEVAQHRCLCYTNAPVSHTWSFRSATPGGKPRTLSPRSAFASNNGEALRDAAVRGVGLAILPTFIVAKDLLEGRLVQVLPELQPEDDFIYAVYPRTPFTSRKLRAFIEHMRLALLASPWDGLAASAESTPESIQGPAECARALC
ncbi:LysR family transcriptional regulator [Paraburkholderia tagetis]|uniref:LysR family transcriptional regulator n=1 Tax=Paraburkholderia tagetis TaxID=2913261 RepID=A0A9X1RKU0_9BURK|nr:LysR family transcriptional regulator [Paraburkholderia tagetis]